MGADSVCACGVLSLRVGNDLCASVLILWWRLSPEWNEKFIWKADYAIDHAEIRAFVLDYTDQVRRLPLSARHVQR
eukprot:1717721-Rhodomonas_salina.3